MCFLIEVLFNAFIDLKWGICIFNKIRFNAFYIIMKIVLIVTNFERPNYQTFNSTNLVLK